MKINISNVIGERKYTHKIPCKTETTSNFGFYQPIFFRECAAKDTVSIRNGSIVRLQPVTKPTFGRLSIKQYTNFVGIADIWHPFDSFLSGKSYSGAIAQYIPEDLPNIPLWMLNLFCMCCSEISFFTIENYQDLFSNSGYRFEDPVYTSDYNIWKTRYENLCDEVVKRGTGSAGSIATSIYDWTESNTVSMESLQPDPSSGVVEFKPDRYDWIFPMQPDGFAGTYLACGRFTDRGKNLRKLIIGLGYQLNFDASPVDLCRFVAYYKTWFDLFAVQREITWKDTHAFNFMEYIEQANCPGVLEFWDQADSGEPHAQRAWDSFLSFWFSDFPEMYYTQNPDYISAHIVGTAISQSYSEFNFQDESGESGSIGVDPNLQPSLGLSSNDAISQQGLDILKKLYQYTNIATAVGGRIKEFMRSIFGSDYKQEEESTFIGASSYGVDITPVMSNAETSEGFLGEYAGRGEGDSPGEELKYTCPRAGYIFVGFCIVPDARFCQGIDPNVYHRKKFDFFTQKFDSLTLLPSRKSLVFGCNELGAKSVFSEGFGNIPNYMEYKQSYDRLNGDMSMRSTRQSLLPFSMQKVLYYGEVSRPNNQSTYIVTTLQPSLLVAGDIWRYIGKDNWLGNFDRIFNNAGNSANMQSGGTSPVSQYWGLDRRSIDDNFVLFFYNDVTVTGFELPVSDSFQTDPFGSQMTVEKA